MKIYKISTTVLRSKLKGNAGDFLTFIERYLEGFSKNHKNLDISTNFLKDFLDILWRHSEHACKDGSPGMSPRMSGSKNK